MFLHQGRLDVHKTYHKNIRYRCAAPECQVETETKAALEEHHKEQDHSGVTIIESLENYVSESKMFSFHRR